jgi:hypothetical protein
MHFGLGAGRFRDDLPQSLDEPAPRHSELRKDFFL